MTYQVRRDCFPTGYGDYMLEILRKVADDAVAVYSTGLSCPVGFTTACSMTRGADTPSPSVVDLRHANVTMFHMLHASETAYGCCPM